MELLALSDVLSREYRPRIIDATIEKPKEKGQEREPQRAKEIKNPPIYLSSSQTRSIPYRILDLAN